MIRLGIIGCGNMADSFVQRFSRIGPRVKVTAVADVQEHRAQATSTAFGGIPFSTDYRDILQHVDATLLVLPHHIHRNVAVDCLDAGKHVLVEKPLANTEKDCLDMIAAAERTDRVLMVVYVMRYHPLVVKLKEVLDAKTYGDCFHLSIWTEQFTRFPDGHWSMSRETLGGGQLFSHGCHYVDLLLWFLGRPQKGWHMGSTYCTPWVPREGTSDIAIRFESGAIGYHMGTWGARGAKLGCAIHAHCSEGMLEADFAQGKLILHEFTLRTGVVEPHIDGHKGLNGEYATEKVLFQTETGKQTDKEMIHFLNCIETGSHPQTDGRGSLQGLRVIWRMYDAEERDEVANLRGLGLDERCDLKLISPSDGVRVRKPELELTMAAR